MIRKENNGDNGGNGGNRGNGRSSPGSPHSSGTNRALGSGAGPGSEPGSNMGSNPAPESGPGRIPLLASETGQGFPHHSPDSPGSSAPDFVLPGAWNGAWDGPWNAEPGGEPDEEAGARPQARPSELKIRLSIISVTLTAVMGVSSIVPVLPLLGRVFAVNSDELGLIVAVFTLPGVFFTLLSGILSDRLGRKAVLIPALVLFSLSGAACAFATSFNMLLFFRFLQGLGAAPLGMLYTTLIGDMYEGGERLKVLGHNTTALGVSTGCYPFIGGLLGYIDWRLTFCLPLLGLAAAALIWKLPLNKGHSATNLSTYFREALNVLKNKRLLLILILSTGTFIILYGPVVTGLPILCDLRFGANPMNIGLLMAISAAGTALAAAIMSRHAARHGARKIIMFSQACYMASMLALPLMTGFWWLVLPMYFYGTGQGFGLPCISEQLLSHVPHNHRAVLMAFNGTIMRLSQSVGPLLAGLLQWRFGLNSIFIGGFILALLLFLTTGIFLREESVDRA